MPRLTLAAFRLTTCYAIVLAQGYPTFDQPTDVEMCKLQRALKRSLDLLSSISSRFSFAYAIVVFFIGLVVTQSAVAGTLDDVRSRDKLICGVSEGLPGFSKKDESGVWRGFDVDFCKAVAAAVLGDPAKVEYVSLTADVRFNALTADCHSRRIHLRHILQHHFDHCRRRQRAAQRGATGEL